jgi:hypothetical protein
MLIRLNYERDLVKGEFNEDYTVLTLSKHVVFKLPKSFPFHPPTLYIHSIEYVSYLSKWHHRLSSMIKKYNVQIDCICCRMGFTWSPCSHCKQMYEEYITYRDKLRLCSKLIYVSKLPFDDNVTQIISTFIV